MIKGHALIVQDTSHLRYIIIWAHIYML